MAVVLDRFMVAAVGALIIQESHLTMQEQPVAKGKLLLDLVGMAGDRALFGQGPLPIRPQRAFAGNQGLPHGIGASGVTKR